MCNKFLFISYRYLCIIQGICVIENWLKGVPVMQS